MTTLIEDIKADLAVLASESATEMEQFFALTRRRLRTDQMEAALLAADALAQLTQAKADADNVSPAEHAALFAWHEATGA